MQTTRHPAPEPARHEALLNWAAEQLSMQAEYIQRASAMPSAASFRRFTRLTTTAGSRVLMDSPPERENNAQFHRLSRIFAAAGVPVPAVLAHDVGRGFLLVSDLGQTQLASVYGTAPEAAAIDAALEVLVRLQTLPSTDVIPAYTKERLHDEFELFSTWLVEGLLQRSLTSAQRALLDDARECLLGEITTQPTCCVHRDYHSRNLLWQDGAIGVVDFQDALWGPRLYDLASLLRDCYHRFSHQDVARWRSRYRALAAAASLPELGTDADFARALDWTAVQRQVKAVGIFARLQLRDGRDTHLSDIAPVLDQLIDVTSMYPPLQPLSQFLGTSIRTDAENAVAGMIA